MYYYYYYILHIYYTHSPTGNHNGLITIILADLIGVDKVLAAYGLASVCLVMPTLAIPSTSGLYL